MCATPRGRAPLLWAPSRAARPQAFALFVGPGEGKPSTRLELRRFSDFLQRECDLCGAAVVIATLVIFALLPLASFHSQPRTKSTS